MVSWLALRGRVAAFQAALREAIVSFDPTPGTSGTLFSAADFSSPGDRSVVSGDILNVTYTFSLSA